MFCKSLIKTCWKKKITHSPKNNNNYNNNMNMNNKNNMNMNNMIIRLQI